MRANLRERVCKTERGIVEVFDIVVETEDHMEQGRLEMFKARATKHQVAVMPDERGRLVVRMVRLL